MKWWRAVLLIAVVAALVACGKGTEIENSVPPSPPDTGGAVAPTPTPDPARYAQVIDRARVEIDAFWKAQFPRTWPEASDRARYATPRAFNAYQPGAVPPTPCAAGADPRLLANNAFYCAQDQSISWDDAFLRRQFSQNGEIWPMMIIAHEWGHHIQHLTDRPTFALQAELQADCYSGMFARHAEQRGLLSGGDLETAASVFFGGGNKEFRERRWFNPAEHGSPLNRKVAFFVGYSSLGEQRCAPYAQYGAEAIVKLGSFSLAVKPGTRMEKLAGGRIRLTPPEIATFPCRESRCVWADVQWLPQLPRTVGSPPRPVRTPAEALDAIWEQRSGIRAPGAPAGAVGSTSTPMTVGGRRDIAASLDFEAGLTSLSASHGRAYLIVGPSGGGLVVEVRAPGGAGPNGLNPFALEGVIPYSSELLAGLALE